MSSRVSNFFQPSAYWLILVVLAATLQLTCHAKSEVDVLSAHGDLLSQDRESAERLEHLEAQSPEIQSNVSAPEPTPTTVDAPAQAMPPKTAITAKKILPKPLTKEQLARKHREEQAEASNQALANLTNINKDAIRHLDRATQLGVRGQLKAAFLEYESAIRINPKLADAYVGKAAVYGYQGQWEKAIAALQTALTMDTDFISPVNRLNAQFNLSSCYCFQGNAQSAWANYQQNLEGKHPRAEAILGFMQKNCPKPQSDTAVTPTSTTPAP